MYELRAAVCLSVLLSSHLVLPAACRQIVEGTPAQSGLPAGYEYEERVEFVDSPAKGVRVARLEDATKPQDRAAGGLFTILVTADGRKYTKGLSEEELQRPPQLEAFVPSSAQGNGRRRLAQDLTAGASGSLSCNGCPQDNRLEINGTTSYPYSAIGQLLGQLGSSNEGLECTGTLIGQQHVVTAAHCVFDINESRKYVSNLNFAPGLDGSTAPYGTFEWTTARVLSQFTNQSSYTPTAMDYDFALVTLAKPVTSGYMSLYLPPTSGTQSVTLTTAGYPGSKPSGTLWQSQCSGVSIDYSGSTAFSDVAQCQDGGCSNIMEHTCISSDGQSGSAMWDANTTMRAILTGKVSTSNNDEYNVGTQIDTFVYNTLAQWYNEDDLGTLPLAPSGPGSAPTVSTNKFVAWWQDNWGKPWLTAVIAVVGGLLALVVVVLLFRCCCARRRASAAVKAGGGGYPVNANAAGQAGMSYNHATGQFIRPNGAPYGTYQHGRPTGAR